MAVYPRAAVLLTILDEDWGDGTATTHNLAAIPRSVEVRRNDHRTADTAKIEIAGRDFPMDPRVIRSCGVRILLGDVATPDGELDPEEHLAFVGFLDVPEATRDQDGSKVSMECRDLTSLFLDTRWPGGTIDIAKPLGDVIAELVALVPGAEAVSANYSAGANEADLSVSIGKTKFAPQKGDDCWSVLTDLCGRVGLVPVFVLDLLMILSPDDFGVDRAGFLASDGDLSPLTASFAYGVDLERLTLRRSFLQARQRQVEVRCWDETARRSTSAKFPKEAIVTAKKIAADGKVTTEVAPILPYYVTGTSSQSELDALAERIWTTAAREEIEITASTRRIEAAIGNGARVTLTIASTVAHDIAGMSQSEAIRVLTSGPRALDEDVASAFVAGFARSQALAVEYYVREATHTWSSDDGYRLEMTLINLLGGPA